MPGLNRVRTPFVLGALLLLAACTADGPLAAVTEQATSWSENDRQCWPGQAEVVNTNAATHQPIRLPRDLQDAPAPRAFLLLRLCIDESGRVARVLTIEASGNADVDRYFTTEFAKRTYVPVERDGRKVKSVVPVSITHLNDGTAGIDVQGGQDPEPTCWGARSDRLNADPGRRRVSQLPSTLASRDVARRSIALKLCIGIDGRVVRSLVLLSTGNKDVDEFYQSEVAKWTFAPLEENGKPIESVVRTGINWNVE